MLIQKTVLHAQKNCIILHAQKTELSYTHKKLYYVTRTKNCVILHAKKLYYLTHTKIYCTLNQCKR
jgi:hypothetical protein